MADRILIEGNIFENSWANAQTGGAILIKAANASGGAPWTYTANITFRNNIVKGAAQAFTLCADCTPLVATGSSKDWSFTNNLAIDIDPAKWRGSIATVGCCAGAVLILNNSDAVTFEHNTILQKGGNMLSAGGSPNDNFIFRNNIVGYGPWGVSVPAGTLPTPIITDNVVFGK